MGYVIVNRYGTGSRGKVVHEEAGGDSDSSLDLHTPVFPSLTLLISSPSDDAMAEFQAITTSKAATPLDG